MDRPNRTNKIAWPLKIFTWPVIFTQLLFPFDGQLLAALANISAPVSAPAYPAPVLTPKNVVVNRTLPAVQPPSSTLQFSAAPTDAEIARARVFSEPIISWGTNLSPNENKDLAQALLAFRNRQDPDDASAIENFLQTHPNSPRALSLLANLGSHYRGTMQFTKAMAAWRETWERGKGITDLDSKDVVDGAMSEMAQFYVTLGWADELQALLKEMDGRPLRGAAYVRVENARSALSQMQARPEHTYKCGPFALGRICANLGVNDPANTAILTELATTNGTSLTQNWLLSKRVSLNYQMAMRKPGAAIPLPAMVHWKQGHFSALTRMDNGRYLVEDGTFKQGWVSSKVLDEEASGYFLIPAGPLPPGWDAVSEAEGQNAWGRSWPSGQDPNTPPCALTVGGSSGCASCGPTRMAQYSFNPLLVSLLISDRPVGYTPPRGPQVEFRVNYNELDPNQPANFSYWNLGSRWESDWLSYVSDNTTQSGADVMVILGASAQIYTGFNTNTQSYAVQQYDQTLLVRTSGACYQRQHPDGSMEIYSLPDSTNGARRVFLTQQIDPAGNALTFTYDSSNRLVSVQDAIGQVTTLSYGLASDPLKITRVTDPFGRYATVQYNGSGQLTNMTDVIGISSSFAYGGGGGEADFISSLTTPYGTTTFTKGAAALGTYYDNDWWLEATDPLGARERVEFMLGYGIEGLPANLIPTGLNTTNMNGWLDYRTTYFWDKKAMEQYQPGDYSKATRYIWLLNAINYHVVSSTLNAVIKPLENPVWLNYPNQGDGRTEGSINQPTKIARVLDDGSTQLQQYQYNAIGKPIQAIDPMGRTTLFTYATNNIDLLTMSQLAAGQTNVLGQFTYNSQHLPLMVVDASGQANYFGYNTNGQLTAITNALNQVTTLSYDTNACLTNILGALPGATATFTYDSYGRLRTTTDSQGYTVTYDYDALNRPTKVTYPDGTYQQMVYDKLDAVLIKDRCGHWVRSIYDAQRHLTVVEDALGRITSLDWCTCGSLAGITDPLGQTTTWLRDLQGRVTTKIYADGTQINYAYENTTSRLKSVTDAKNQTTAYGYFNDNDLRQVVYSNAIIATPGVSFAYDTNYNRPLTMTDGTGITAYSYNPITTTPTLGAGRLASVAGPLPNATITYTYDVLGRVANRVINNAAQVVMYDALGRVTMVTNVLGSFTNVYLHATGLISTNFYPNGQQTVFTYYGTNNDLRLQQIQNLMPNGQNLSAFSYAYDPDGQITNWTEQADTQTPTVYSFGYDAADQLASALLNSNSVNGAMLKQFAYQYDTAGNRTGEQIQSGAGVSPAVGSASYNNLNQLTGRTGNNGPIRFRGSLNETGTVKVAGNPATMTAYTNFTGYANVTTGTNVVSVVATDYSSHSRTNNFQVVVTNNGVGETLTFDLNGNETSVVTAMSSNMYQWDAANRLVSITESTNQSLFTYDGLGRRVQDIELQNGAVVSTNYFVWCGQRICEQRDNTGANVTKQFFGEGEQISGTSYFFTRDHLGSVREMTDNTGAIKARYDYDPYGRQTKLSDTMEADFGYAGMYYHAVCKLNLTYYRPYDPNLGRWLSRDPLAEKGGLNLYEYVYNNAINYVDRLGLESDSPLTQWEAEPCPAGQETRFIQVVSGGPRPYYPLVDNGSRGLPPRIFYPASWGNSFADQPGYGAEILGLDFEVCRVCFCEGKIVSVGPCKTWKRTDYDQNLNDPTYPDHPYPSPLFRRVVNNLQPGAIPPPPPPLQGDFPPTRIG
jgi:RHS repeat-associated protein